jgi:hypothetical protein
VCFFTSKIFGLIIKVLGACDVLCGLFGIRWRSSEDTSIVYFSTSLRRQIALFLLVPNLLKA